MAEDTEPAPLPALTDEQQQWIEAMVMSKDIDERTAALEKVASIGDAVVGHMIKILDEDTGDDGTGAWAAEVLIQLGPKAAPAAEALAQQLIETTECNATTSTALQAIGAPAIPHLIRALDGEIPASRQWAANALGNLTEHEAAAKAVPRLVELLADDDSDVRDAVLFALRDFGPAAHPAATAAIIKLLDDVDGDNRYSALDALAPMIRLDPKVRARIEAAAQDDPEKSLRSSAKDALELADEPDDDE